MVRSSTSTPDENAKLRVNRGQAAKEIGKQIEAGEELLNRAISNAGELKTAKHDHYAMA